MLQGRKTKDSDVKPSRIASNRTQANIQRALSRTDTNAEALKILAMGKKMRGKQTRSLERRNKKLRALDSRRKFERGMSEEERQQARNDQIKRMSPIKR